MMIEVSSPPEYARTTFLGNGFSLAEQQGVQKSLLHVESIFRLIVNDGTRRIDHALSHFQAPVGGQAVQEHGIGRGLSEELLIDLIPREGDLTLSRFAFLTHAGPHVRVNGLRASNGFLGRTENLDFAATLPRSSLCFGNNAGIGFIAFRGRDAQMNSGACANAQQRMAHVIAVANIGELQTSQIAEAFLESEEIGQGLAGMKLVGERVDYGNGGVCGQLIQSFLGEDPRDDALHPALEIPSDIANRLTLAQPRGGVVQKDGRTAEIGDARLKRDTSAQGRFFENEDKDTAREGTPIAVRVRLHFPSQTQEVAQLPGAPFSASKKVSLQSQCGCGCAHIYLVAARASG